MRRKVGIASVVLGCILAIVIGWMLTSNEKGALRPSHDTASPTTERSMSPVVQISPTIESLEKEDEAAEVQPAARQPSVVAAAGKYNFTKWQDAVDEFAKLVGIEYDRLWEEGHRSPASLAVMNVSFRIFRDNEYPELLEAMKDFVPFDSSMTEEQRRTFPNWNRRIPEEIWRNPRWIAVWAGKMPEGSQFTKLHLPNGTTMHLKEFQRAKVSWEERYIPAQTRTGQIEMDFLRQYAKKLETDLETAQDEQFDRTFLELERVKAQIDDLSKEKIAPREMEAGALEEFSGHPEFEIIEVDLGIIDRTQEED